MLKQSLRGGVVPRTANGLKTGFKACMYKFSELSSGTMLDTLGNGPNFTGIGSLTTGAAGGLTPAASNTTKYATAAANAYLYDIVSLIGTFGELIIAFDWKSTVTDVTSTNTIFNAGRFNTSYASGGLALKIATNEKIQLSTQGAGTGGATQHANDTGTSILATSNRCTAVVSIRLNSTTEAAVDFMLVEGINSNLSSTTLALDSGVGSPAFGSGLDDGYAMCAIKTAANTYGTMLNSGALENATIRNLLLLKTPTYDSSLASSILLDMSNNPGEIPRRILQGSA